MVQKYKMKQFDLFGQEVPREPSGQALKERGMQQAESHANQVHLSWSEQAERFLKNWIRPETPFTIEQAVEASEMVIPQPPTNKAWGGVIVRLKRQGFVKALGIVKAKKASSHTGYITQWIKC